MCISLAITQKRDTLKKKTFVLTVFLVEEHLDLDLLLAVERLLDGQHGVLVRQFAVHEATRRALLHYFGTTVAGQLAEAVVAVDDRVVDDARVRQQERAVCSEEEKEVRKLELRSGFTGKIVQHEQVKASCGFV